MEAVDTGWTMFYVCMYVCICVCMRARARACVVFALCTTELFLFLSLVCVPCKLWIIWDFRKLKLNSRSNLKCRFRRQFHGNSYTVFSDARHTC
jgi:hypothetical protein